MTRKWSQVTAILTLGILAVGLALALQSTSAATQHERTWYITVLEPKGGTTTDKLVDPPVDPRKLSKGYTYTPPGGVSNQPARWEVSAYLFAPAGLIVLRGEQVNLKIYVVNGDHHVVSITGPDGQKVRVDFWISGEDDKKLDEQTGVAAFKIERGRENVVSFIATMIGTYTIGCATHEPSMSAQLVVF